MIIYFFNEIDITKINISLKTGGMYPIILKEKLIANISLEDNALFIKLTDEYMSSDLEIVKYFITPYKVYNISSRYGTEHYTLIAIPKLENNTIAYDLFGEISIGANQQCSIYYTYDNNIQNGADTLKLLPASNNAPFCFVETNSTNFFISGHRAKTGEKVYCGDYIFFLGLKVIYLGSRIIVNNPNSRVKIISSYLKLRETENIYKLENINAVKKDLPLYNKNDYYFKAPRFDFIVEEKTVNIDEPPASVQENDMPLILTIGPQITMLSTSLFSMINFLTTYIAGQANTLRFITSIGTLLVTISGTLLWPNITRKINKRQLKDKETKRQEKYAKYLEQKKIEIDHIKRDQKFVIEKNHPSTEACLKIINDKSKELWQRSIDHEDFLSIRLGIGIVSTKIKINEPTEKFSIEDEDGLFIEMKKIVENSLTISDVPINYTFTNKNINAIVGEEKLIKKFLDSLFLQIMTFHSYADLKIIAFTKEPEKWDYLRITPHCWDNKKSIRYFTTTVEELSTISIDLEKVFDARVSDNEEEQLEDDGTDVSSKKKFTDFRPYYLLFIDDMTSVRNVSLINKILHYKRNMGFSIIITSQSISTLPSETSDFICISETEGAIMNSKINDNQKKFKPDYIEENTVDIYASAQKLANIPVMVEKEKYELPSSLTFLELYNLGRVEQLNSLSRWVDNNPVVSLAVPIGIDQSGEIFKMDIHEKAYGPHGLVAGTTGSGKSEWIITYILSLAVNFSPEEVQFVLIDYKGGGLAKSFENRELGVKLPHLAGTITNLDKSEIFRSIAAIESELKRRQAIFNNAREKLKEGSMNIYKYQQFYRKGLVDKPLSHLFIICDEFAEMKQQQPDFMEQLISTSRIGRSLGIHLILATQKPSGVVNDQIWSNSKFKVALKVQDKGDSNEILKKPDAAFLKQTGSFYLQVGNDDYYNLGQSAWAGAKYFPSDIIKHKIDDSIQYIDNIGRTVEIFETEKKQKGESQGEELLNIVAYLSKISEKIPLKGNPLWLPNIADKILLFDLYKKYNRGKAIPYNYNTVIGEYDEPRKQMQGLLNIDLSEGNIAIIGQNGSGTENLISTIIMSSICDHSPHELAYYIIDFGSETLKKFAKFPHVGEVVFQEDMDKVLGVLDLVMEYVDERKELLSDYNGSFEYYNKVTHNKKLPLIITIINGFDIFIELIPKLSDILTNLFRDAAKYGIIFIISGSSSTSLRPRQLQYFNHLIVMQLNDDTQYRNLTNCRRGLIPKKVLGRGICKTVSNDNDSYCEFQTAMISAEEKELEIIKAYADKCVAYYKYKVKELAKIPDNVKSADLIKYLNTLNDVPIGINFYEKDIAKYDFLKEKVNLITGKKISNNINFIYGLLSILSKLPNVKVRVVDMIEVIQEAILDVKLFNDNIDVVFGALENDVLTRTDVQDYGVNIIIGAGQFKKKLSAGGIDIFRNTFNNVMNSKKCIFILIDDYDKIRTLKLESCFNQLNTASGMWLGTGFANQSLFNVKDITTEDKKYDFDGLAYSISNGEYKVIKTVMDGDE